MNMMKTMFFAFVAMVGVLPAASAQSAPATGVTKVAVQFSGGHGTDPRDRGRPVVLVAAGLGVTPEVFREAFSRVRPAPAGAEPDPRQVRDNKSALLGALAKYGVTNERLDTVSNYYRYRPGRDSLWTNRPATAIALVKDGVVTGFEISDGGAGYSSPPEVTVPGYRVTVTAMVSFVKDLAKNGSIASLTLAPVSRPSAAK